MRVALCWTRAGSLEKPRTGGGGAKRRLEDDGQGEERERVAGARFVGKTNPHRSARRLDKHRHVHTAAIKGICGQDSSCSSRENG